MKKSDIAAERMRSGFNCAQSVFSVFTEEQGMSRETAFRIACGFGAGFGGKADVCGAVSGMIMAIGAKYGKATPEDNAAKEKTYALVKTCLARFAEKNGSLVCRELLGHDISTAGGLKTARKNKLFETRCVQLVRNAAEILDEMT
jgi:C_GCAxxG_C_C family probable redox protein